MGGCTVGAAVATQLYTTAPRPAACRRGMQPLRSRLPCTCCCCCCCPQEEFYGKEVIVADREMVEMVSWPSLRLLKRPGGIHQGQLLLFCLWPSRRTLTLVRILLHNMHPGCLINCRRRTASWRELRRAMCPSWWWATPLGKRRPPLSDVVGGGATAASVRQASCSRAGARGNSAKTAAPGNEAYAVWLHLQPTTYHAPHRARSAPLPRGSATTHTDLELRARGRGIPVKVRPAAAQLAWPQLAAALVHPALCPPAAHVATPFTRLCPASAPLPAMPQVIHNASIMNAVGACGLQLYRFGEAVSIVFFTGGWGLLAAGHLHVAMPAELLQSSHLPLLLPHCLPPCRPTTHTYCLPSTLPCASPCRQLAPRLVLRPHRGQPARGAARAVPAGHQGQGAQPGEPGARQEGALRQQQRACNPNGRRTARPCCPPPVQPLAPPIPCNVSPPCPTLAISHPPIPQVYEPPRFMSVGTALSQLLEVEEVRGGGAYGPDTLCVGVARIGSDSQRIVAGSMQQLLDVDFGPPLHSLVIAGDTHPIELEYLEQFMVGRQREAEGGSSAATGVVPPS